MLVPKPIDSKDSERIYDDLLEIIDGIEYYPRWSSRDVLQINTIVRNLKELANDIYMSSHEDSK